MVCRRKVRTRKVSRAKKERKKVSHWCHTWEKISTSQLNKTKKKKKKKEKKKRKKTASVVLICYVKLSAVASWNENHGSWSAERWHISFGVFVCVFLKPYCFFVFFFLRCFLDKGCDSRLPAWASRTPTRPLLNHPSDCIDTPQAPKTFFFLFLSPVAPFAAATLPLLNLPFISSWNWNSLRRSYGHFNFYSITLRAPLSSFQLLKPPLISFLS